MSQPSCVGYLRPANLMKLGRRRRRRPSESSSSLAASVGQPPAYIRPANENCRHSRYRPGIVIIVSLAIYALASRVLRLLSTAGAQSPAYADVGPNRAAAKSNYELSSRGRCSTIVIRWKYAAFNAASHRSRLRKFITCTPLCNCVYRAIWCGIQN